MPSEKRKESDSMGEHTGKRKVERVKKRYIKELLFGCVIIRVENRAAFEAFTQLKKERKDAELLRYKRL